MGNKLIIVQNMFEMINFVGYNNKEKIGAYLVTIAIAKANPHHQMSVEMSNA